ncbi:MAG: hypothetical protein ACI4OG_03105 [Bacilli bacterium]
MNKDKDFFIGKIKVNEQDIISVIYIPETTIHEESVIINYIRYISNIGSKENPVIITDNYSYQVTKEKVRFTCIREKDRSTTSLEPEIDNTFFEKIYNIPKEKSLPFYSCKINDKEVDVLTANTSIKPIFYELVSSRNEENDLKFNKIETINSVKRN